MQMFEAIRKIKYKQMMWKTFRHTGSEEEKTISSIKKHLIKLQLKFEIQREAMNKK